MWRSSSECADTCDEANRCRTGPEGKRCVAEDEAPDRRADDEADVPGDGRESHVAAT